MENAPDFLIGLVDNMPISNGYVIYWADCTQWHTADGKGELAKVFLSFGSFVEAVRALAYLKHHRTKLFAFKWVDQIQMTQASWEQSMSCKEDLELCFAVWSSQMMHMCRLSELGLSSTRCTVYE